MESEFNGRIATPEPLSVAEVRDCIAQVGEGNSVDDTWHRAFEGVEGAGEIGAIFGRQDPTPWLENIYRHDVLPSVGAERLQRLTQHVRSPAGRAYHSATSHAASGPS